MSPFEYINQIFDAKAARNGGVVRRKIVHVLKYASFQYLLKEVQERGFHLIETEVDYVVICSTGHFQCWR